jgi:hypothetical protein
VAGSPLGYSVSVRHSTVSDQYRFARAVFRIELSDTSRLSELREFYVKVQAVAQIDGNGLVVRLPGPAGANDEMLVRAYLQMWLTLAKTHGGRVRAELSQEQAGFES